MESSPEKVNLLEESATGRIQELAARIESLPALPAITAQMLEAVDDPHTSAARLANLISVDQALSGRLLKLANSAYYGFPRRIGTVNLAVVVLGFETVRDLSLSILVTDCFFHDVGRIPLDMEDTWKHALAVAVGSRMLFRSDSPINAGEGFVAGLLHDIGKLFLARYFPEDYQRVLDRVQKDGAPLLNAEREVLGTTHAAAGAWLLDAWKLPAWLVDSTRDHHGAQNGNEPDRLAMAIYMADLLTHRGHLSAGPGVHHEVSAALRSQLNLKSSLGGDLDYDFYLERLQRELVKAGDVLKTLSQPPARQPLYAASP